MRKDPGMLIHAAIGFGVGALAALVAPVHVALIVSTLVLLGGMAREFWQAQWSLKKLTRHKVLEGLAWGTAFVGPAVALLL